MVRLTFTLFLTTLSLLPSLVLSQSQSAGPCIDSCATSNPTSSFCDGDETGSALDTCRCDSYLSAGPLITCMLKCEASQIAAFAARVPEKCRNQLFPGVNAASASAVGSTTAGVTTSAAEGTGASSAPTTTTAASGTSALASAAETAGTSTGAAAAATTSGSAGVRNANAVAPVAAVVGGVLAVLAL